MTTSSISGPHWHILGAGAIGCLCAAALSDRGLGVTIILRDQSALEAWRTNGGIAFSEVDASSTRISTEAITATAAGPIEQLLISTKAYDARNALAGVLPHLASQATVLLMVNGLGIREELLELDTNLNIAMASTTEGVRRREPFDVQHAGAGATLIGQAGRDTPPDWFAPWAEGRLAARWCPDIEQQLWLKLAINCAINPLTAVHGCRNGALATGQLASHVRSLCDEAAIVLEAEGMTELADQLETSVFQVIEATSNNRSSMLQDIDGGRPTEIAYITGYLLQRAQDHRLELPHNRELMQRLEELERAKG